MCEYIKGLVQERRNPIANALELRIYCTNSIIYICVCVCVNFGLTMLSIGSSKDHTFAS